MGEITSMPLAVVAVIFGLTLLMLASDRLVVSAVRVSQAIGVSAILIGALVVGLGTSLPELLVSILASIDNRIDVAMANVVGSNIANVSLVLGFAAVVAPVAASRLTLRREGVLMFGALLGLTAVLWDGTVEVWEGGMLLGGMVLAVYFLVRWSMYDAATEAAAAAEIEEMVDRSRGPIVLEIVIGFGALVVTVVAANFLLEGGLAIGREVGLSDAFLGVMLGVGTSLPELATAVAAIRRRESDLVVGNVLGSNIFNSLAVAGAAGAAGGGILNDLDQPLLLIMLAAAVFAGLFSRTGLRLGRIEGIVLLMGFFAFTVASY
ncbi:MAG: sodium:calcium antiporter [Acidimicrobiia bacterium]|nr:sodium:calcium antiporter [Acidimicrobiia bacterium]